MRLICLKQLSGAGLLSRRREFPTSRKNSSELILRNPFLVSCVGVLCRRQEFRTSGKNSQELRQRDPFLVTVRKIWRSLEDNASAITAVVAILGLGGSFVACVLTVSAGMSAGISADIKSLETKMAADIKSLRNEMSTDNKSLRNEMTADIKSLETKMSTDNKSLETKIDSLRDILLNHEGRIATNSVKVDLFKPRID